MPRFPNRPIYSSWRSSAAPIWNILGIKKASRLAFKKRITNLPFPPWNMVGLHWIPYLSIRLLHDSNIYFPDFGKLQLTYNCFCFLRYFCFTWSGSLYLICCWIISAAAIWGNHQMKFFLSKFIIALFSSKKSLPRISW